MCCFSPDPISFSDAIARFVTAQAGLIAPQLGRTHFNLHSAAPVAADLARGARVTCCAAREPVGVAAASTGSFNLEACFTMVSALDLPDRIVGVWK